MESGEPPALDQIGLKMIRRSCIDCWNRFFRKGRDRCLSCGTASIREKSTHSGKSPGSWGFPLYISRIEKNALHHLRNTFRIESWAKLCYTVSCLRSEMHIAEFSKYKSTERRMMFSSVMSAAVLGMEAYPVQVEADISDGLPMFCMVETWLRKCGKPPTGYGRRCAISGFRFRPGE